jgi:hypothetical protein
MIDSPLALLLLGSAVVSGLSYWAGRRRKHPLPPAYAIPEMPTPALQELLYTPPSSDYLEEISRRRILVLVVEELERRALPPPQY